MSKIDQIIAKTSDNDWLRYSGIYLHNSNANIGKGLERETLSKIASESLAGCDKETIAAIAAKENENWSPAVSEKKIKLYLLQHRSGYNPGSSGEYLTGSLEECYTSSSDYISIAQTQGLEEVEEPSADNQGYANIASNERPTYHLFEYGRLFGQEKPYGFAYSISTAACLFNGESGQIQSYSGYFYEGDGDITGITGGGAWRSLQSFIYTRGGGPITSDNWIIKVVESQTYALSDTAGASAQAYCFRRDSELRIVIKTYIHFFLPDGSYVRRSIDRSTSVDQFITVGDLTTWYYQDFSNISAKSGGHTFKEIWNKCYSGNYKIFGRPNNKDFSLYWNQGEPGGISNGKAIHPSLPNWNGKEVQ